MDEYYFLYFLLNMGLWLGAGVLVSFLFLQNSKRVKRHTNLIAMIILSSFLGGAFGFMVNGIPNLYSSINNLTTAFMFAIIPTLLFFPKARRSRRKSIAL